MSRHPVTLMTRVPTGNPPDGVGHRVASPNRASAPSTPPAATAASTAPGRGSAGCP